MAGLEKQGFGCRFLGRLVGESVVVLLCGGERGVEREREVGWAGLAGGDEKRGEEGGRYVCGDSYAF